MFIVPGGMLVNALFLYLWRVRRALRPLRSALAADPALTEQALPPRLPSHWNFPRRLSAMVAASLAFWLVAATVLWTFSTLVLTSRSAAVTCGLLFLSTSIIVGGLACFKPLPGLLHPALLRFPRALTALQHPKDAGQCLGGCSCCVALSLACPLEAQCCFRQRRARPLGSSACFQVFFSPP